MLFKHCEPFWNLSIKVNIDSILASKVEELEATSKCQGQPGCRLDLAARCQGSSLPPGEASPGWWLSRGSCCTDQCCLLSRKSLTPRTGWRSHPKPAQRTDGNAILNLTPFHLRAVEEKAEDQLRILNIVDFVLQESSNCYHRSNLPGMYKHQRGWHKTVDSTMCCTWNTPPLDHSNQTRTALQMSPSDVACHSSNRTPEGGNLKH